MSLQQSGCAMPVGDLSKASGQPQFSDDEQQYWDTDISGNSDDDDDDDGDEGGWGESPEHGAAPQDSEAANPFTAITAAVPPAVGGNVELPGPQAQDRGHRVTEGQAPGGRRHHPGGRGRRGALAAPAGCDRPPHTDA